jgi:hypothetical protein
MLYIIDNEGKTIEVTDLNKAMEQAKTFHRYRSKNPSYSQIDKVRHVYWKDIYLKLLHTQRPEASLFYFQVKTCSCKKVWKNIQAVPLLLSDTDIARIIAYRASRLYKAQVRLTIIKTPKKVGKSMRFPW